MIMMIYEMATERRRERGGTTDKTTDVSLDYISALIFSNVDRPCASTEQFYFTSVKKRVTYVA
jgi:hypothetical protein